MSSVAKRIFFFGVDLLNTLGQFRHSSYYITYY